MVHVTALHSQTSLGPECREPLALHSRWSNPTHRPAASSWASRLETRWTVACAAYQALSQRSLRRPPPPGLHAARRSAHSLRHARPVEYRAESKQARRERQVGAQLSSHVRKQSRQPPQLRARKTRAVPGERSRAGVAGAGSRRQWLRARRRAAAAGDSFLQERLRRPAAAPAVLGLARQRRS